MFFIGVLLTLPYFLLHCNRQNEAKKQGVGQSMPANPSDATQLAALSASHNMVTPSTTGRTGLFRSRDSDSILLHTIQTGRREESLTAHLFVLFQKRLYDRNRHSFPKSVPECSKHRTYRASP